MSADLNHAERARSVLGHSRWWLIAVAAAMMAVVGPYQYVWSVIREPVATNLGIDGAVLSTVFTLFVIFQAGSQFPVGSWRDAHGPRGVSALAAVLAGGGYLGVAYATQVWQVYVAYSLGAIGVGIVYTVAVNTALKWFPDRRGLTSGVGTMAFAGGSAALVPYLRWQFSGAAPGEVYTQVLRTLGIGIFLVLLVGAYVLRDPPSGWLDADGGADGDRGSEVERGENHDSEAVSEGTDDETAGRETDGGTDESDTSTTRRPGATRRQYTWREMLRTWQFWLMYAMFVAVSGAGLMLTEKIVAYNDTLDLAAVVGTLAATVLPLSGGVGRLVFGELSDRVSRRHAMAVAFSLCGLGLYAVVYFGVRGHVALFVIAVVVATFFWSPQYTLFPSVVGDYYGDAHSSANYALLYSGKMWGGIFGGTVTGVLATSLGWNATFLVGGTLAILSGFAALALRPPDPVPAESAASE